MPSREEVLYGLLRTRHADVACSRHLTPNRGRTSGKPELDMIAHLRMSAPSGDLTHVKLRASLAATDCPTSHCKLTIEHYPGGSVVARVFLTANPSVYTPVHESVAHCWREKE